MVKRAEYCDTQKALIALESYFVLQKKLKNKDLTLKVREILYKECLHLLDQAKSEAKKPISLKEGKFFTEPYLLCLEELEWDAYYYRKPIRDPVIIELRRRIYGTPLHRKLNDTMRFIRIYIKKIQLINKLHRLKFTNNQEEEERKNGMFFQIISSFLISKYTSYMIKGFEVIIKHGKVTVKQPDLHSLEAQMNNYALMREALELTISFSAALQDKLLSEEKRNENIEKREKSREVFKHVMELEAYRAYKNNEDSKSSLDERREIYYNFKKFINLYIEIGSELYPNLQNYASRSPYVEKEVTMIEIHELGEILRKSDLSEEERKYFLQRKDFLEKEIDYEGEMQKLLMDLPFDKDVFRLWEESHLKRKLHDEDEGN